MKAAPLLFLAAAVGAAPATDALLRDAASAYRQGDLLSALSRSAEVLAAEPTNAVAKNYVWTITQELQKKRPRLNPGEKEKAAVLARRLLEDRRRRTQDAMDLLRETSRRSGNLRSPTGLLGALEDLDAETIQAGGSEGRVHMDAILSHLQEALDKQVFVSRKDHLRASGYLAYYQKDWPQAVAQWEKALKEDPGDRQIRSDLESLQTMLRKEQERGRLKELVAQAEAFQETGLYAQAVASWRKVLALDSRRPGVVEALAASQVALEKTTQLKKLDAMNEAAADLYGRGDQLGAAQIWLEILQLDPTYKKARVWLALVGKSLRRADSRAAPAPRPAPEATVDESKAEELYKKGLVAYAESRLEEANAFWRQALAANPHLRKAGEALKQSESELSLHRR